MFYTTTTSRYNLTTLTKNQSSLEKKI